ncbi:hypothetical protein WISP_00956 [Willisornis vidua]|uniref:Uncharacterized protein n=1 Tax=Willisornis vidua TaxID=1566151 RepID=A0ABQ9E0S9_9PASS|nr:hypothetical protein WISP_00956 [Willisornis vidua]
MVSNLNSYGADIINMCSGVITYQAYEVHGEFKQMNSGEQQQPRWEFVGIHLELFEINSLINYLRHQRIHRTTVTSPGGVT